uniref:Peptidase S74 domain-containing protein n=1 Tax=viral metagenome TaxID=1070528 RepID=A0A6C0LBA1_9ZZZZ
MVWNIGLSGNDYKILNSSSNNTTYNSLLYLDYFTINENGNVGINNGNPKRKLDINGDILNNGILISSNILGNVMNTSNFLQINYKDSASASANNVLDIYGTTLLRGNLGIGTMRPQFALDVAGIINARELIGTGSNVYNINASNINAGILNVLQGGTGVPNIIPNQLIYGDNNKIRQSENLIFEDNILKALFFEGNGSKLRSIDASTITQGVLGVTRGGTGLRRFDIKGGVILANLNNNNDIDRTTIAQSEDLKWDNIENAFEINGNIKLPAHSNLLIGGAPLNYTALGDYPLATCNIPGVVKLSSQFKINNDSELILANTGSSKWGQVDDFIFYPPQTITDSHCVGIGILPEDTSNRLIVNGNINIVDGVYKINGVDMDEYNSNIISQRINNFTLDNIDKLFCGNKNRCFSLENIGGNVLEYQIGALNNGTLENNNNFKFLQKVIFKEGLEIAGGTFDIGDLDKLVLKALEVAGTTADSIFGINQNGIGNLLKISKSNQIRTILTNDGNMGVGIFNESSTPPILPLEKLHIMGNIIATGTITSCYSDKRLKTFTSNISNSLDIISNLNGYYYHPNEDALKAGFENEKQIGLSAQEVQSVLPEIVKIAPFDMARDDDGNITSKSGKSYLTICYERLGPVFVEAIKELTGQIKELKEENATIKKDIETIKNMIASKYLN